MENLLVLFFGLACGVAGWSMRGFVEDKITAWEVEQGDEDED
jgi:hypothetical protein